ncbi:MAG: DUF2442 domain-containing protein [Bacteroidota bacterium]
MSTLANNFDTIEKLIYEESIRIETIDFHPELDMMLILLNTKAVLHQKLSDYRTLKTASKEQLEQFELIAGGTGVHWQLLDEDHSLKGFLRDELRKVLKPKEAIAA